MKSTFAPFADPGQLVRLLQQGRFDDAWAVAQRIVTPGTRDPGLLQLAAIAANGRGDFANGVVLLRRAQAAQPNDAAIAFNLAKALGDSGDPTSGLTVLAKTGRSADLDVQRLRAELLKAAGRDGEAVAAYRALIAARPGNADLHNNIGNLLLQSGQLDEAVAAFERARAIQPGNGTILINLAKAYAAQDRGDDALAAAEAALAAAPGDWNAVLVHARALNRLLRHDQALPGLLEALQRQPDEPELVLEIGRTFIGLGEFDKGEEAYRLALKIDPGFAQGYLKLGTLIEQSNRLDELDALIEQARQNGVTGPEITFIRALAARRAKRYEEARHLVGALANDDTVDILSRTQLLGDVADRLNDSAAAFAAFSDMNEAASRSPVAAAFTGNEYPAYIRSLTADIDADWVASWPMIEPGPRRSPAFLVGFPRSGTTLLDTVLMGHPDTHVLEEEPVLAGVHDSVGNLRRIPDLSSADVAALREQYFAGVEALGGYDGRSLIIDKLPLNLLRAPLIHRLFPDARFILALRHPCDAVLSCFMQNFKVNRAMAAFWRLETTAATYDGAFTFWEKARSLMPLNVHAIRYEDMVADMPSEIGKLVDFLGLERNAEMLDFQQTASERTIIRTPSYAAVTEGLYRRAQGRWTRYRDQMAPVLPVLAPWAERYGYSLDPE